MAAVTNVQVLEISGSMDMQPVNFIVNNDGDFFVSKFHQIRAVLIGGESEKFGLEAIGQRVVVHVFDVPPINVSLVIFGS